MLGALALGAAPARAEPVGAQVQFDAFSPAQLHVLPGEDVQWANVSERTHTVTADDGSFDSGELPGGAVFGHRFDELGVVPYHCRIHPSMRGEVTVAAVILFPIAVAPVPAGERVEVRGRTADPDRPVIVERDAGAGFGPVATATPAADGTWSVRVAARSTADYRASGPRGASETQRLLVIDRHVDVTATARGVFVTVTPAAPQARVMLEVLRRERFGWWPTARQRLDYLSRAHFRVGARPARVRVSLVDRDGWTRLVTSRVLRLPRRGTAR